jgi:hypothetical protein
MSIAANYSPISLGLLHNHIQEDQPLQNFFQLKRNSVFEFVPIRREERKNKTKQKKWREKKKKN